MTELEHGTRWAYSGRGCRCDVCVEGQAVYFQARRERMAGGRGYCPLCDEFVPAVIQHERKVHA